MCEMLARAHRLRGLAWLAAGQQESAQSELLLVTTVAGQIGQVRFARECHRALANVGDVRGDETGKQRHEAHEGSLAARMVEDMDGSGLNESDLLSRLDADQSHDWTPPISRTASNWCFCPALCAP